MSDVLGKRVRHRRIYGPTNLKDGFHLAQVEGWTKPLLAKIDKIYSGLKIEKEVLDHGFCFGLLDPAANIVITGFMAPAKGDKQAGDMVQRSLNGLVAFLTYLFPYLPEAEAVEYLEIAGADPLVAAHLVVIRRGLLDSCLYNNTAAVETALICAAVAARHPASEKFLFAWKLQSSEDLKELAFQLSSTSPDYSLSVDMMNRLTITERSAPELDVKTSWELAGVRLANLCPLRRDLPPARAAMKRILLDTIHGFYLKALGCLPKDNMDRTYHRSMLFGGHCYGPLDPVSNIIINTIWFDLNYPVEKRGAQSMVSTKCLWRIAVQSLYGLISFMCTRYKLLTPDLAMHRLLLAGVDLRVADPHFPARPDATGSRNSLDLSRGLQIGSDELSTFQMQADAFVQCSPFLSVEEAYAAAAKAAFHPDPIAQTEFLGSYCVTFELLRRSEFLPIRIDRMLSRRGLQCLRGLVYCYSRSNADEMDQDQELMPMELGRSDFSNAYTCENRFFGQVDRVVKMVEHALCMYNFNRPRGHPFRLHVICAVNELVSGPEFSKDPEVRRYNPWTPDKYHHSHINFLAVQEDQQDGPATLFFAEGSNHGTAAWCLPVKTHDPLAEQVRCIYCEEQGIKIVHTVNQPFHGRDMEFVKVLQDEPLFYGLDKYWFTNDRIVQHSRDGDWVHGVEDDAAYANYCAAAYDDDCFDGTGGGEKKKLYRPSVIA